MHKPPDVFAKIRDHERVALMRAAREHGLLPYFHEVESPAMPIVQMDGKPRIMLGSNNYLGLTADERVMAGARDALARYGTGLTGSRLLNGTTPLHLELEHELAEWMGTEDAIVFTTGQQANVGTLATLLGTGDTVVIDSADHASLLDGALLSRAKLRAFRHNRMDKLESTLEKAVGDGGGVLVVVDGVFSMEGDVAPLREIAALTQRFGARLMVDEAHAVGVLGARGAGTAELLGVEDLTDLRMGTFSKSLASCGGFVAGDADVIEFLKIQSRAFLFTASGVPAAIGRAGGVARDPLRGRPRADGAGTRERAAPQPRSPRAWLRRRRAVAGDECGRHAGVDHHADRAGPRRRGLAGRSAVAGAVGRGRVHKRRRPSRGATRRSAASHERDGHPRRCRDRPCARRVRDGQAGVRGRARAASRAVKMIVQVHTRAC
jgi:7-keto-8-aminopelargonate synthetase-like enzyme